MERICQGEKGHQRETRKQITRRQGDRMGLGKFGEMRRVLCYFTLCVTLRDDVICQEGIRRKQGEYVI